MPARQAKAASKAHPHPALNPAVMLALALSGFEDGLPYKDRPLASPDRWAMQAADSMTLTIGRAAGGGGGEGREDPPPPAVVLALVQRPRSLATAKAGVGAVLWPGGVALAAALVSVWGGPPLAAAGQSVLEMGAGAVGLPSLVAAALGGRATATDRAAVLPLLACNVAAADAGGATGGRVTCAPLDWGEAGACEAAAALAANATLILAADCVYEDVGDPSGSPDAGAFVSVLAAAMGAAGCPAWVAVEPRSSAALAAFTSAAAARCTVTRLPPPVIVGSGDGWALDHIHLYELRL